MIRCFFPLLLATAAFAQTVAISGAVSQPLTLTAEDLAKMPHISVTVDEHGTKVAYEGVKVFDLLQKAGAPVGKALTGKALASYVLATAKDGYQVVYTLTEFDPAFSDSQTILADKADGKPLAEKQGPFRLVVPGDKKPTRSIRMLEKLEVVRLGQ